MLCVVNVSVIQKSDVPELNINENEKNFNASAFNFPIIIYATVFHQK